MERQLWERLFELEERILDDALTLQSSLITVQLHDAMEAIMEEIMPLGYSREAIEEYGLAWLQLTPLWEEAGEMWGW